MTETHKIECSICREKVEPAAITRCDFCHRRTCEECGHTISKQKQQGSVLNAVVDQWQCSDCEFSSH